MIRQKFFERKDLTPEQGAFLETVKVLMIMLGNAAGAFEQNQPSAALQIARHADVIAETAAEALNHFFPRDTNQLKRMFEVVSLAQRCSDALYRMCSAGAAPLEGLDDSRDFLASLCRGMADQLDWSAKRQLLGAQRGGSTEDDVELSLSELPSSLAGEENQEHVQAYLDFRDALLAARELFGLLDEVDSMSEELFPVMDDKYWKN
jgi:hypothetical protein